MATCSHDTGAAVAAVPADNKKAGLTFLPGPGHCSVSSLPGPLINEKVREHNFTNELGYGGTTRFLKNIVGLWMLQESVGAWLETGTGTGLRAP